jgi:hypothetical protein
LGLTKRGLPEGSNSERDNLLCTLPRTTLPKLAPRMVNQLGPAVPGADLPVYTQSMQVTVNPYSIGVPNMSCDTDNESQYASVVYSSPTMARRVNRFAPQQYSTLSSRGHHLSPQLNRLTTTLRQPTSSSVNSSPIHRNLQSSMSSTTTISTCISPRSGRYQLSDATDQTLLDLTSRSYNPPLQQQQQHPLPSYDTSLHHVYCEIPYAMPRNHQQQQVDRLRLQQQLKAKLRQQQPPTSFTDETDVFGGEDATQCDLHNISDLSDDEHQHTTFSIDELSFHGSRHSSPKHHPRTRHQLNNSSSSPAKSSNNKKRLKGLQPPPLSIKDAEMSQLPSTDV